MPRPLDVPLYAPVQNTAADSIGHSRSGSARYNGLLANTTIRALLVGDVELPCTTTGASAGTAALAAGFHMPARK